MAAWALLTKYHDIFSLEPGGLGCTDLVKYEIRVIDDEPFKDRFQRIPPLMIDEVHAHMKEMFEVGAICPNQSPCCNAVVLVCKMDGGLCLCIDFHKLNARTKKDSYPLPWIQEAIESLVGAGCFSCLDLKVGFWQIAMDEVSKQYTTFTTGSLGFFECEHMLFGLCNATATFQRLVQKCLGELNLMYCLIYLDNVIVFSKMEEEHLKCLHIVLDCFWDHNLKLKPMKCEFFWDEINYLAHHVSNKGMWPSKENLKAVAEFPPPWTYMEIWAFLGLMGHYRWFIKGFAHVVQPLHEHLSGDGACKKGKQVALMEEAKDTFETLKRTCLESPLLDFADFDKPFLLETDDSKLGLGAALLQKQVDGWYHLVAYASLSLTTHEHNYHSIKQEFLVLKWAIAEQFPLIVKTNNTPLNYIMTTTNLDATRHQWVESLAQFTFSIEYQMGHDNVAANVLHHITSKLDAEVVKSILDSVAVGTTEWADAYDPSVAQSDEEIHKPSKETVIVAWAVCVDLHVTDRVTAQQEYPALNVAIEWISSQKVQDLEHLLGDDSNT